ncbi:MAG: DUF4169 family protein [Rhodospirillales bacterium]|nr:MAG: DUF4169 family protein [Rhodospirillales bacterium]
MAEIVNLRAARKRRARDAKSREADANRASFGVSTTAKAATRLENARAERTLRGHRIDGTPEGDPPLSTDAGPPARPSRPK